MRTLLCGVVAVVVAWSGMVNAQDSYEGRIDINGTEDAVQLETGKVSEGGSGNNASWMDEAQNKCYLVFSFPATSEWQKGEISFKPSKNGSVIVRLMGAWVPTEMTKDLEKKELKQLWTLFDDLSVKGAELKNCDFETATDWGLEGTDNLKAAYLASAGVPHGGKNCIKVWHNGAATQKIDVKAGTDITITFWYKADTK